MTLVATTAGLATPAQASTSWSLYVNSGRGTGQFTGSSSTRYFHVGGTIRDYYAGDDCTKGKVLRWGWDSKAVEGWRVWKEIGVCGGASAVLDTDGYLFKGGPTYVRVQVCQDYTVGFDPCTEWKLYP